MLLASLDDGLLAAAPQAISVDFDATFLVQFVLFAGLTLVLKPLLFDPMLKLFEERERRIDGAKLEARRIDDKSTSALAKYESEMAKARASANAEREKLRAEAVRKEQEILGTVRAAAARTLEDGKKSALAEAERVRATLKAQSGVLARDLAGRVLGREVQS
jgi:F-type H+-transporting ATPase subunit b